MSFLTEPFYANMITDFFFVMMWIQQIYDSPNSHQTSLKSSKLFIIKLVPGRRGLLPWLCVNGKFWFIYRGFCLWCVSTAGSGRQTATLWPFLVWHTWVIRTRWAIEWYWIPGDRLILTVRRALLSLMWTIGLKAGLGCLLA